MLQLGWKCLRWTAKGEPVEFSRWVGLSSSLSPRSVRIRRAAGGVWKLHTKEGEREKRNGQVYPVFLPLDTPLLPGPVAAAIWFDVEKANGGVRIRQSENKTGS